MNTEDIFDADYSTKQSAGYMFVQLLTIQLIFMIIIAFLVFVQDEPTSLSTLPFFHISTVDIILILLGIIINFILFVVIFAVWQSIEYRISTERLDTRKGIIMVNLQSIKLTDIEDCLTRQGILGKIFNYGTIELYLHDAKKWVRLKGVPFADQFLNQLKTRVLVNRNLENMRSADD
jgi:membrane protein YdbS with pleckstrin-like domain